MSVMTIPALNVTPTQQLPSAQLRAAAPEESSAPLSARAGEPPPATLVIERAPRLSFIYTKIDPNTGEEFWRWTTRPSDEQAASEPVRAIGQLTDVTV